MAAVLKKYELEAKLKDEHQLIASGVLRDENPLDQSSDFANFLQACRKGDLKTCQELISSGVNINGKDRFDYTPLIIVSGTWGGGILGDGLRRVTVHLTLVIRTG